MHRLSRRTRSRIFGFTLVELMITVALTAILGGLALPYLGDFIDRSRTRGTASELEAALYYARAEAIARSSDVSVCAQETAGADTCAPPDDGKAWKNGWLVMDVAANVKLRSSSSALPPEIRIEGGKRGSIVFTRTGLTGGVDATGLSGNGTLKFIRNRGSDLLETCLVVNAHGGRIRRLAPGTDTCSLS